jgi:hypothetical protein
MPGAKDLHAVLDPLVKEFGLDNDIYRTLHHRGHSISDAMSYNAATFETDNTLLVHRLRWILQTCRDWNLKYGQKDVLEALARACRLGMKTPLDQ